MKTALEQLIEKMQEIQTLEPDVQVLIIRGFAESMKATEKQQIVDAYEAGEACGLNHGEKTGTDYFTQTFKND
jgi:adenylate kinase